jgi:hypothetical protein
MSEKSVIEIDDRIWQDVVEKRGGSIVVMFYSPSCPHCLAMMPYFERYAIYPTLLKKITKEALHYASSCASKSTPIDYNMGYA